MKYWIISFVCSLFMIGLMVLTTWGIFDDSPNINLPLVYGVSIPISVVIDTLILVSIPSQHVNGKQPSNIVCVVL